MSTSNSAVTTRQAEYLPTSINHPRLQRSEPESVRRFMNLYDQYVDEVRARARQLGDGISTEAAKPVKLKFRVDVDLLKLSISLGLIIGVTTYDALNDDDLRKQFDGKAAESRATLTLDGLDAIVKRDLKMDMRNKDASSRMKSLFVKYHTILGKDGLAWLLEDNQMIAVRQVLSAIQPSKLRARLQSDNQFAHYEFQKDFQKFFAHARKFSDAFVLVGNGSLNEDTSANAFVQAPRIADKTIVEGTKNGTVRAKKFETPDKQLSLCLWDTHKSRGLRHLLKDCWDCPEDTKKLLFEQLEKEKEKDGPASNTRSKNQSSEEKNDGKSSPTAGRPQTPDVVPTCQLTVSDGLSSMMCSGRCDDGSDDSISSPQLAEDAVVKGIGRMSAIKPVSIQVALQHGESAQRFTFSRVWTVPRITLKLATGPMALKNVSFLVAGDKLACEDVLIGLPVLKNRKIHSRSLLDRHRETWYGTDCASIGNTTKDHAGSVGRLILALMQCVKGRKYTEGQDYNQHSSQPSRERPLLDYDEIRQAHDPYPDPSLVEPLDALQKKDFTSAIEDMMLVFHHIDVFRDGFSHGPLAKIEPLRIELSKDAKPLNVKLRNYSEQQTQFMSDMKKTLVKSGMVYANPTAGWDSAPLFVLKSRPSKFRFTVYLRLINRYTKQHHFPMLRLETEMTRLAGSRAFENFDMSHGDCQLELAEDSRECHSFITPDGF